MPLLNLIKRALGFTADVEEDDNNDSVLNDVVIRESSGPMTALLSAKTAEATEIEAEVDAIMELDDTLPGRIFDSLIRLFNRTMPEFVKQCLDTDSQREYLYHALESDLRQQLIAIVETTRRKAQATSAASQGSSTKSEVPYDELARELRRTRAKLSRQKKALDARIATLEELLQKAHDENATLQDEILTLKRRLRKSRSAKALNDAQPSLFEE